MAERKLHGREYRCDKMLATKAIHLQVRLMKFIGPALDRLPELIGKENSTSVALTALGDIVSRSDPDETVSLIREIVSSTKVKNPSGYQPIDIDLDFSEHLDHLYELVVWILKEQYSSFFSALLGSGARARPNAGG